MVTLGQLTLSTPIEDFSKSWIDFGRFLVSAQGFSGIAFLLRVTSLIKTSLPGSELFRAETREVSGSERWTIP